MRRNSNSIAKLRLCGLKSVSLCSYAFRRRKILMSALVLASEPFGAIVLLGRLNGLMRFRFSLAPWIWFPVPVMLKFIFRLSEFIAYCCRSARLVIIFGIYINITYALLHNLLYCCLKILTLALYVPFCLV